MSTIPIISIVIVVMICIVYGISKLRKIYLFKKHPPGSGKIISTTSIIEYEYPKNVRHYRILDKKTIYLGCDSSVFAIDENDNLSSYAASNIASKQRNWKYRLVCEIWE